MIPYYDELNDEEKDAVTESHPYSFETDIYIRKKIR